MIFDVMIEDNGEVGIIIEAELGILAITDNINHVHLLFQKLFGGVEPILIWICN